METIFEKIKKSKSLELRICFYINGVSNHITVSKTLDFEVFSPNSDKIELFIEKKTNFSILSNQKYESEITKNGEKIEFSEQYNGQQSTFIQLNLFYA